MKISYPAFLFYISILFSAALTVIVYQRIDEIENTLTPSEEPYYKLVLNDSSYYIYSSTNRLVDTLAWKDCNRCNEIFTKDNE